MAEQHCIYPDRESVLVAYLYGDDIDTVDRVAFDTHLAVCERCRTELADFRDVRSNLAQWAAPESARTYKPAVLTSPRWWSSIPAWAQVAAAMLVLGVSASIANLDVRYDRVNGLSVRTGWSKPAAAMPTASIAPAAGTSPAPWRAELAAMQTELRKEMRAQAPPVAAASTSVPAAAISDAELYRRVRVILDESERKQTSDVAMKLVQLQKDVYLQQQLDIAKVYRALGLYQNATQNEFASTRAALKLAVSGK
jgi:hypothetical protein